MPMTRKRPSRVSTYVGPPPLAGLAQERCSDLHWFRRTDERTRTADLISLRVITHALQGCAEGCNTRIFKRFPLLRVAECCTALRFRWYQSGIKRPPVMHRGRYPTNRSFFIFTVPGVRGDASSLDRYSHWIPSVGRDAAEEVDEALG